MQTIKTIWIILIGDHPGTIPAEFGQIPISVSREEVVWSFPYIIQCSNVKSNERFQRRCLSKNVYARRTTHDGRWTKTDHNSSPWALCAQLSLKDLTKNYLIVYYKCVEVLKMNDRASGFQVLFIIFKTCQKVCEIHNPF